MPGDPKQCRLYAARYLKLSERAKDPARRQRLASMAETWTKLAAELESDQPLLNALAQINFRRTVLCGARGAESPGSIGFGVRPEGARFGRNRSIAPFVLIATVEGKAYPLPVRLRDLLLSVHETNPGSRGHRYKRME